MDWPNRQSPNSSNIVKEPYLPRLVDVQRESASTGWLPAVDGLRAIAVLLVLDHHIFGSRYALGNIGVAIFFGISGFLAYWVLRRDEIRNGRVDYNFFLFRRVLRIWPAYATVIAIVCLFLTIQRGGIPSDHNLWPLFFFSSNLEMASWRPWPPFALAHLWSIAVEEQFYVLAPLMYLALRSRWSMYFCVAIFAFSNAARIMYLSAYSEPVQKFGPFPNGGLYYMTYAYADTFLAGAIIAHLKVSKKLVIRSPDAHLLYLLCAALLWSMIAKYWAYTIFPPYLGYTALIYAMLPLGSALLIVTAIEEIGGWWPAILASVPMRLIGRLSYSLYLVHPLSAMWLNSWPETTARPFLILLATFVSAAALYFGIERPFLKLKGRTGEGQALYPLPIFFTVSAVSIGLVRYFLN